MKTIITLTLLLLTLLPAQAIIRIDANPINVAFGLSQEMDSAKIVSTLEYYGYEPMEGRLPSRPTKAEGNSSLKTQDSRLKTEYTHPNGTIIPFSFVCFNHPGDYEKESITFRAEEDIDSLYDFLLIYSVEDTETGLPDYYKTRILTIPEIELQKGSLLEIFTEKGEDSSTIDFDTTALNQTIHWGLSTPIWHIPNSSYELMKRGDSIGGGLLNN